MNGSSASYAVTLDAIRPGSNFEIAALAAGMERAQRRRLLDLGFTPGALIRREFSAPSGDPIAYLIRGTVVSLRRAQASLIKVRPARATRRDRPGRVLPEEP